MNSGALEWRACAAGEQLEGGDLDGATAARAFIVQRLHEQIDAAVADAYGWPHDLAQPERTLSASPSKPPPVGPRRLAMLSPPPREGR